MPRPCFPFDEDRSPPPEICLAMNACRSRKQRRFRRARIPLFKGSPPHHFRMQTTALQRMRDATADLHTQLEQRLRIAQHDAGRDEFLQYLLALHAWQAGFEQALWESGWPERLEPGERARKCRWMEQDLHHAGLRPAQPVQAPYLPQLTTRAQRIGVAYVVEGAQLGTQVLRKRLATRLGDWQPCWLQGYGEATGRRWKAFVEHANAVLSDEPQQQQAATAARETFAALAQWLAGCQVTDARSSARIPDGTT